jgi:hypothetical protein
MSMVKDHEQTPSVEMSVAAAEPVKADTIRIEPVVENTAPQDAANSAIFAKVRSATTARPRMGRFAVLAASMTIAAALGSVAGALAGIAYLRPSADTQSAPTLNAKTLQDTLARLNADISALKSGIEASSKTTAVQMSKITDRFERNEKAQAEPAARLAKMSETLDRLERKSGAEQGDITGSIGAAPARNQIVDGWVLREIYDGRALVENRFAIFEVGPGSQLPGIGRVEGIRRQDGRWVVVTPRGLIVSSRN